MRARHAFSRPVALKVLPAHLSSNPDFRQRFEREARTVSALNHPHICTLYDVGHQDGTDYLVMDGTVPRTPVGIGDCNFSLKYNLREERAGSHAPGLAVTASFELPTGDAARQLGSGVEDFGLNAVIQKRLGPRTVGRFNAGLLLSGNTLTGAVGLRARGLVGTGGRSIKRSLSLRLELGAEVTGALARDADLAQGQLQLLTGGHYAIRPALVLDFALLRGWFVGAPRYGVQIGFSADL